ncbi:MAG TPA: hypothetical protein DCF87_03895 [Opitutae bacterium]|nr:hypothetical protein [Opitutae bacterium]
MRLLRSKRRFYALGLFVCLWSFLSSCELNPLSFEQTNSIGEKNSTEVLPVLSEIAQVTPLPALESKELEAFILQQMGILKQQLSEKLAKIDPADADQIQQIVQKELVVFLKDKQDLKYQFLCDENERWIYRCNRMTGEIECFSMSSNKLRLLSSTR